MGKVRMLTKIAGGVVVCAALGGFGLVYHAGRVVEAKRSARFDVELPDLTQFASEVDVALGRRIVHVRSGCVDCHGQDLGGGTVVNDPLMGRIDGPNLTPTKLASWTDAEIVRAIRHGVGKESQALVFMPATDYIGLSGGDLASLVAYLRSVPPINRQGEGVSFGPLGKILAAFDQLPIAFSAEKIDPRRPFATKPAEAVTAAFGGYLAQACTGCHNAQFSGGVIAGGPPDWAPASDLTPSGIGTWSEADFIRTMRTGVNPSGQKLRPPFPAALVAQMSDVELKALWTFLVTVPPSDKQGLAAKAAPHK